MNLISADPRHTKKNRRAISHNAQDGTVLKQHRLFT